MGRVRSGETSGLKGGASGAAHRGRSWLPSFTGERPRSMRTGLEPAFLLLETDLMERLRRKAATSGTSYDYVLKEILRDHIDEY